MTRRLQLRNFSTEILDSGSGPALMLLHSLGLDKQVWSGALPWLGSRFRVIAHDLRGHGAASPLQRSHDIATHAADLAAVMDHLGVDRAHVVGLSFGGAVAQQFASEFPARVQSLTLMATVAAGLPVFDERAAVAERRGLAGSVSPTLERWFSRQSIEADAPFVRYARQCLESLDIATWVGCWTTLARFNGTSQLASFAMPTHVIVGSADLSTPAEAMQRLAGAMRGARFTVIDDASHLAPLEFPRTVAAAITSLLDDEPGVGPWLSAAHLVGGPFSPALLKNAAAVPGGGEIFMTADAGGAWVVARAADRRMTIATRDRMIERIGIGSFEVRQSLTAQRIGAYGDLDREAPFLLPIGMPAPTEDLEELDRWYREEHVGLLLRSPCWHSIERYRIEEISHGGWTRLMLHGVGSPTVVEDPFVREAMTTPWRNRMAERPWFLAGGRHISRRVSGADADVDAGG